MTTFRKTIAALALTALGLTASSVASAEKASPPPPPAKVAAVKVVRPATGIVVNGRGSTWS